MADLEFDFEDNLEQTDLKTQTLAPTLAPSNQLEPRAQKNYRQTVCRHWLRNLCMKGDKCGFLHQFDKERMPTCRYFAKYGECKEPDCPYKHSNDDVKECKLFTGKASNVFQFEVPKDWVIAIDRPVEEKQKKKAETKVVVGQFKTVDTMSVRLEIADESVRKAFALAEEKKDAKYIEQEFTKEEREAAAGKIAQDVIVGVENNRSGVMKFVNVGDENENTTKRIERDGKAYYVFQSISEVCRAEITEIGGGKKICIGPRGDEIDTIERRAMTVVTVPDANDGSYFVLKMSAKVDRWEETKEKFERAAETFRML